MLQFLDMQEDEELRTHLNIFHAHKEEDLEEFSHRYDNVRMELEYPSDRYQCLRAYFYIICSRALLCVYTSSSVCMPTERQQFVCWLVA